MIEDTIGKIEQAIKTAGSADPEHRAELIRLLEELKAEIHDLPSAQEERAASIAHFAETAAHVASRRERSPRLLELSREGLKESAVGFETSHPRLSGIVNEICSLLSSIGI